MILLVVMIGICAAIVATHRWELRMEQRQRTKFGTRDRADIGPALARSNYGNRDDKSQKEQSR